MKVIEPYVEFAEPIDGDAILKHLEMCGRVCYKSEQKIAEGSAEKFLANIIKRGHEAVLEHYSFTVRFVCDRGVSHEIVRHRLASYCQESQRYCVAGNMFLNTSNPHVKMTVKDLFENKVNSKNGAWKRMSLRQYNEETGELQYAHVNDIFSMGEKDCLSIKTRLGYEIICTPDHMIMSDGKYVLAGDFKVGDKVMVNGTEKLYTNRDWLYTQNITLNKTFAEISREFGFNVSTLKKWGRIHGLPKKGRGYYQVGRTPWNKGVQDERQVNALRQYHHCGRRKDKILKENTCRYQKRKKDYCEICGASSGLDVHHIDENHSNNFPDNLITLCVSCHGRVHSKNLLVGHLDEIVSISYVGKVEVYDISMKSDFHNFVANGVVVHNCNYSKDQFNGDVTFIKPLFFDENTPVYRIWERSCKNAETAYFDLLNEGCTPQEARTVLPNSVKTGLVMTANVREWRHFLKLRTSMAAHPSMRQLANKLLDICQLNIPVLFDDIGGDAE